jgi:hypothetical protein
MMAHYMDLMYNWMWKRSQFSKHHTLNTSSYVNEEYVLKLRVSSK